MGIRTRRQARRLSAALSEIKRLEVKTGRLEAAYRQSLVERVIDLEIGIGVIREKERDSELSQMVDAPKYPVEALEHLRRTLLTVLAQRNHPSETSLEDQPRRDYIQ